MRIDIVLLTTLVAVFIASTNSHGHGQPMVTPGGDFSFSHSHSFSFSSSMSLNVSVKRKKHCLKDVSHWVKDHCECNEGFTGHGDLCCYPKEYNNTCVARCDPYVTSSAGQSAQVFNPCGQTLTVIAAKTKVGNKKCRVTVRSSDVIEKGIFATAQVEINYEIGEFEKEYVVLNGYKFANGKGDVISAGEELVWKSLNTKSHHYEININGEAVVINYDCFRKIWYISACGTAINFRRDVNGGKPGVCINSKYPNAGQGQDTDSVCNRIPGNWLHGYHTKAAFYLAKSFEMRENQRMRLRCYTKVCQGVTEAFNVCGIRKKKAMKMCSPILEKGFRGCAFLTQMIDGEKLFELFANCMKAHCTGNVFWCVQFNKSQTCKKCPLPNLKCCNFKMNPGIRLN